MCVCVRYFSFRLIFGSGYGLQLPNDHFNMTILIPELKLSATHSSDMKLLLMHVQQQGTAIWELSMYYDALLKKCFNFFLSLVSTQF